MKGVGEGEGEGESAFQNFVRGVESGREGAGQ